MKQNKKQLIISKYFIVIVKHQQKKMHQNKPQIIATIERFNLYVFSKTFSKSNWQSAITTFILSSNSVIYFVLQTNKFI